jgi:GrpB-like predicted nucleotidyltransferase (UPF0157 family)
MSNPNIGKRPYKLVDYDPEWPKQFERYARQMRAILDDDLLEIHHFGSTAIPGMFAKPNIDVYALATSLEAVRQHSEQFEELGFVSRGDYSNIGEEYFTLDTPEGERIASIHIFEGSPAVFDDYKSFKDYLLTHDDERQRYITLKQELYAKYKDDYPAYDAGKKQLIDELKASAQKWAKTQRDA